MPRYFFDVEDGHRLFDSSGFVCDDDIAAITRAATLAIGVSLTKTQRDKVQTATSALAVDREASR